MMAPRTSHASCAIALALLAGCDSGFDPYNRLESLRVLAIAADPPNPQPGAATTVSALLYTPEDGASEAPPNVTFAWSWCPFPGASNDGYACGVTEAEATAANGGVPVPSFNLGSGPTAKLDHTINPALLQQICKGMPGAPQVIDCDGGFPAQVKLVVTRGGETITTVSTVRLALDASIPPNNRPVVEGLSSVTEKDGVKTETVIAADPSAMLVRNVKTIVKATVPASVVETYLGKDNDLRPAMVKEKLTVTWFVESGKTDSNRTSFIDGELPFESAMANKWTPPKLKDFPRTTARIVVVVRDNRGGVGWRAGAVTLLEKKPESAAPASP